MSLQATTKPITMKAFQFEDVARGLELKDIPVPKPTQDQVLIRVNAVGLCHSDCHIIHDKEYSSLPHRPMTLGHEVAGTIVELGASITGYEVGDQIVSALAAGGEQIDWSTVIGLGYDGGYAEFAIVEKSNIVRIPYGVTFAQAAIATDCITTAYHAVVTKAGASSSTTIGIIGLGGLGLSGVRIATLKGAKVYGVDIDTKKFAAAEQAGAVQSATSIDEFEGTQFDAIVDFAGAGSTTFNAIKAVKTRGTVVLVGLGSQDSTIPTQDLVVRMITLRGSLGGTLRELKEVLELLSAGSIAPILEEISFEDIPSGLDRLTRGGICGRLFANPSKS